MAAARFLESTYPLSEQLSAEFIDDLSTASQFLDTPVPRLLPWERQSREPIGGRRGVLTRRDLEQEARERRAHDDQFQGRVAARQERMEQAQSLAESLIEPSHFCLQVFAVYLRATIEAKGFEGCHYALRLLTHLLGTPWDGLVAQAPTQDTAPDRREGKRRARLALHVDAVFGQFHAWCSRQSSEDAGDFQERALAAHDDWSALGSVLDEALQQRNVRPTHWEPVRTLLFDLVPPVGEESLPRVEDAQVPDESEAIVAEPATSPVTPGPDGTLFGTEVLRVAPRFFQLRDRLAAFITLLDAKHFLNARLVASDLSTILTRFDAAVHFPDLFANFFVGCAQHATDLAQFSGDESNPRWGALSRLYATDLARFMALQPPVTHPVIEDKPTENAEVVTLVVSTHFRILRARLRAFDALLERQQFLRAALVAHDIDRTLHNFDVAAFFPGLFADYFVGMAEHAAELAQFEHEQNGPRWAALTRLYETDLRRFTKMDAVGIEEGAR